MTDELTRAVEEVVDGLCRRHGGGEGAPAFSLELWSALEQADLVLAALAPEHGGAGAGLGTELAAIRVAARACAPLPLAETGLAGWLLAGSGRRAPRGRLTIALAGADIELAERDGGWRAAGSLSRVPWAREAELLVVLDVSDGRSRLLLLSGGEITVEPGANLAGEPRDGVRFDLDVDPDRVLGSDVSAGELTRRGALVRTAALAGAAETALALSVEYVGQRQQFGRPLVRFQAVQQRLAIMVGEVRAMRTAAEAAAAAVEQQRGGEVAVAAAKAFASAAAGSVAAAAHQLHGAIGFTEEHRLHLATSRLWSWREEFGDERRWSERLGEQALAATAPDPWPLLTGAPAS